MASCSWAVGCFKSRALLDCSQSHLLGDGTLPDTIGSRHRTLPAHVGVGGHHTTVSPLFFIGLPLSDGVGWVKVTVRRRRYFVRRRRHVRQQDSPRVSPRPACDAGCSMLHARVVFGRGWACVWLGAGGRGVCGGAGWYALQDAEEASSDAVCSQNCQE